MLIFEKTKSAIIVEASWIYCTSQRRAVDSKRDLLRISSIQERVRKLSQIEAMPCSVSIVRVGLIWDVLKLSRLRRSRTELVSD